MDLRFTPDEEAFRTEIRDYLVGQALKGSSPSSAVEADQAMRMPASTSAWHGSAGSAPTAGPALVGPSSSVAGGSRSRSR